MFVMLHQFSITLETFFIINFRFSQIKQFFSSRCCTFFHVLDTRRYLINQLFRTRLFMLFFFFFFFLFCLQTSQPYIWSYLQQHYCHGKVTYYAKHHTKLHKFPFFEVTENTYILAVVTIENKKLHFCFS